MIKRERKLTKTEQADRKRKIDQAKGLRRVKGEYNPDDSDESYHTMVSEEKLNEPYQPSESSSDPDAAKDDELEDIFNQNVVQVHAMLAEAFVKGDIDKELAEGLDIDDKIEMSEKQRIRCLLLI